VRLEQSRTSPGSGLGLSLVKAVAKSHGADLHLKDNHPGLSVELVFPKVDGVAEVRSAGEMLVEKNSTDKNSNRKQDPHPAAA
jgi:hypothetical protein